jgi:hypothetical protein
MMMEVIHSSKTSILTRVTWHNIPEHGNLHGDRMVEKGVIKDLFFHRRKATRD